MKSKCLFMLIVTSTWVSWARPTCAETIETVLEESQSQNYVAPTREQLSVAYRLFASVFAGKSGDVLQPLCGELGLELVQVQSMGEELLVLREHAAHKEGRGVFIFRRSGFRPLAIQAPHSRFDLHTGVIAKTLFLESRAVAAAWNTVRRYEGFDSGNGKTSAADLAHLEGSFFQSFTRAFADAQPKGVLVQLHGFGKKGRETTKGARPDIILSNGSKTPPRWLVPTAQKITRACGAEVAVYPFDIMELGGTTNWQGKLLRSLGHSGFLHVELNLALRRKLTKNAKFRRTFLGCLPEKQS